MLQPRENRRSILHVLNTADVRGTGIAKIVRTIATRLRDHFHFAVWFVYEDGPLVQWLRENGIDAKFVPVMPGRKNLRGPLNLWSACRSEPYDLVHHHSADTRVRWILRAGMRAPILLHLHGRAVETDAPVPTQFSTRYADRVITVSHAVAAFTPSTSEVIYTGVDQSLNGANVLRHVVIGTACRFVPLKGVDRLLRAFALARGKRPDLVLEIAGDGPARDDLRVLANELGVADSVTFLGWQQDVRAAMRRWSIYVHPSLEEGLGLSIIEAMAEGLPTIATRVGGIPEVVRDGETGWLVSAGDERAIAERLIELASDDAIRKRMGETARAYAEQRFSSEQFVRGVERIYEEMLTEQARLAV